MSARSSTAIAAKQAIILALKGRPEMDAAGISYADPGDKAHKDQLFFRRTRAANQEATAFGGVRQESYILELTIDVLSKKSAEQAEEQAFLYFAEVEDVLANNPSLGVEGVLTAVIDGFEVRTGESDGPITRATINILVTARVLARG